MKLEEFKNMLRALVREELKAITNPSKDHETPHKEPHLAHAEGVTPMSDKEICEGEGCLDEKSVPQPYNRKTARKMSKSQIEKRDRIGKSMEKDEKTVSKFRKKYGQDWKSHLWRSASSAAFREKGSTKADDKKKR
jgi:hypothetical protein